MITVLVLLALAAIFIVSGILVWLGKAPYILDNIKDKNADEKKCALAIGITGIVIGICMIGLAFFGYRIECGLMTEDGMAPFAMVFCVVIFVAVCIDIHYAKPRK